jgi:predicted ester cyclase
MSVVDPKQVVLRFNKEVLENGNEEVFRQIMHEDFVNRTPTTVSNKADGVWQNISQVLRPAFPDLKVVIYDQIAEGDKVTTRKAILGTHLGTIMGVAPTERKVKIDVIDIVRVKDGKYLEHWGINNLYRVVEELKR